MQLNKEELLKLIQKLDVLTEEAIQLEQKYTEQVAQVHPAFRKSTINLLHYLGLRRHDIRELQEQLAQQGLSSLGRAEGHVMANLQAVRRQLKITAEAPTAELAPIISFADSAALLQKHTDNLLGPALPERKVRIMVTFATEMATDYQLVLQMMQAGMNCARLNLAHDDKTIWEKMVNNIKQAEKESGLGCKILFDLMGPKLRTGPLKPGPKQIAVQPLRNEVGQILAPAQVWLTSGSAAKIKPDAILPVPEEWLDQVQADDQVKFKDTRGRKRILYVKSKETGGVVAHLFKTSYLGTGTQLTNQNPAATVRSVAVGELPNLEIPLSLHQNDLLVLHKEQLPGEPAQLDAQGQVVQPAHIACTLPEVFGQVEVGQPILFDDGEIEGEIQEVKKNALLVKITSAGPNGSRLRADKGINLPESSLGLNKLTDKDKQDLTFVVKHADIVNLSFVNHPSVVEALQAELEKLGAGHLGIMLKIETQEGFRNLPHLLLAVMRSSPAGIMIARGDLAVECGWQRLAEVQEEILWLCEAAHMPVVWATQVLEKLAKKGRPSRAEITDAAMAQRADCVMLNKGPYIIEAIRMLDGILQRMQQHQHKKASRLRSLNVSDIDHLQSEDSAEKIPEG